MKETLRASATTPEMARALVAAGAELRARNRRGAEPLHAAVIGNPGSSTWHPADQRGVILFLVESGADPNAAAAGDVTPLHRAVRNRCSAAVGALLLAGANPLLANTRGSTAYDLALLTTGRGGSGSVEAKAEQRIISIYSNRPSGETQPQGAKARSERGGSRRGNGERMRHRLER